MSSPAIQIENLSKSYRINPLASHLSYRTLREDLVNLFKGDPLVVRLEEGKYFVDVVETFRKAQDKLTKK